MQCGEVNKSVGQLITVWGNALQCTAVKDSVGKFSVMQYTLVQFGTVQCTMYLPLHSFRLKLCSATIDLEHNAVQATVGADEGSVVNCSLGQFSSMEYS